MYTDGTSLLLKSMTFTFNDIIRIHCKFQIQLLSCVYYNNTVIQLFTWCTYNDINNMYPISIIMPLRYEHESLGIETTHNRQLHGDKLKIRYALNFEQFTA